MRAACGADLKRLCADSDKPGMCLQENWEELSPKCRAFKAGMKKQWDGQKGPGKTETAGTHFDVVAACCFEIFQKMRSDSLPFPGRGSANNLYT